MASISSCLVNSSDAGRNEVIAPSVSRTWRSLTRASRSQALRGRTAGYCARPPPSLTTRGKWLAGASERIGFLWGDDHGRFCAPAGPWWRRRGCSGRVPTTSDAARGRGLKCAWGMKEVPLKVSITPTVSEGGASPGPKPGGRRGRAPPSPLRATGWRLRMAEEADAGRAGAPTTRPPLDQEGGGAVPSSRPPGPLRGRRKTEGWGPAVDQ
mmetsp:Transcript_13454/g.25874  ORF Transcript_13454/g.25874 Transcript_13454/m.25874 type:complete len:211 (-) Transcript_13454:714-1346(-)